MASLTENDKKMIADLRSQFKKKYIDPPEKAAKFHERDVQRLWNNDLYALSFVHWKKEVIKDAVELTSQCLEWRKENTIPDLSVNVIGDDFIKRGVCYTHGRALDGTRVLAVIGRLQVKEEKEKLRKLLSFMLERLQRYETGQHVTFVLDCHKTAMSNVDLGMIRFIIDSFTLYFPDLLERIIILDMPWIMNAIWNIVKQWMSEEQRSKVAFCSRKDLHKFIAVDQRPESMAGTVDWEFSYPPFPDDLGQDKDFKNDPMNFKREDSKPDGTASPAKEPQANGDVMHDDHLNNNNTSGRKPKKIFPEKKTRERNGQTESPCTSNPVPVENGPSSLDGDSISSTPRKPPSPDHTKQNGGSTLRSSSTGDQTGRLPSQVSFKSIAPFDDATEAVSQKTSEMRLKAAETDEITLGNLLIMSPVSELVFMLEGERLEGYINIRNPNLSTAEEKVYVAYKVKTTSPELYHVKPSVGFIAPDGSARIRIYLKTGHESSMSKDRFLLLYKQIPVDDDDDLPSHGEVTKFWKKHSDKSAHSEHRIRVKVDESVPNAPKLGERKSSEPDFTVSTPTSSVSFLAQESTPKNSGVVEIAQMQQQISLLSNKMTRLESDTRWMRRRMRHTMLLLFVIIILMFFILYEVTMVSYQLSSNETSSCSQKLDL